MQQRTHTQDAAGSKGQGRHLLYDQRVPVCQNVQHACCARLETVLNRAGVLALGAGLESFKRLKGGVLVGFYQAAGEDAKSGGGRSQHEIEL